MNRRSVGLVAAVAATAMLAVGGIATAAKSITGTEGNIHAEFNGGFSPQRLAKTKPTPVSSWTSVRLKTLDGSHIPPLKELLLEGDRNASISVEDIPVCDPPGIWSQSRRPDEVRKACRKSLVGRGRLKAEIKFFDQDPIPVTSELLAFKGGVTTFYLHAYITIPTPAAIITVVKIKRVNKGRFGLESVSKIPKIAGGSGSVTFLKLRLKKGILSAKCPAGHLDARTTAVFDTTPPTKLGTPITRPCTGFTEAKAEQ